MGNALDDEITLADSYDYIFINIGGEETQMFMEFIDRHMKKDGKLLISGLVEWTFDLVITEVNKYGYTLVDKKQTNEWCTSILIKDSI